MHIYIEYYNVYIYIYVCIDKNIEDIKIYKNRIWVS